MDVKSFLWITLACLATPAQLYPKFSYKKVTSLFKKKPHIDVIQQEYTVDEQPTVTIDNIVGSINIKTEWGLNSIVLSATKHVTSSDQNGAVEILSHLENPAHLMVKTVYRDEHIKGAVDYELIVPKNTTVNLNTKSGDILVNGISGHISASTLDGAIDLENTAGQITAEAHKNGSITIENAEGDVTALGEKGAVSITHAKKNVIAQSSTGRITVESLDITQGSKLWAKSETGTIQVYLPEKTNADLYAKTDKGTVTCEVPVTLKTRTTTLDKKSWKQFKQEVDGVLGTGNADIKLVSHSSSIKIKRLDA